MMGVLPYRFGNNQRRVRIQLGENIHTLFLRPDESVSLLFFKSVGSLQLVTTCSHRLSQRLLHFLLRCPAILIGRKTKVTVGNEKDLFVLCWLDFFHFRKGVSSHRYLYSNSTHWIRVGSSTRITASSLESWLWRSCPKRISIRSVHPFSSGCTSIRTPVRDLSGHRCAECIV